MTQENKQGITQIILKPSASCFCPLGDDWYTNRFYVVFDPEETFPDYCDIEKFLDDTIRGRELIIEDAVSIFFDYLMTYDPANLKVTSYVDDVTSHSPVSVTKEKK